MKKLLCAALLLCLLSGSSALGDPLKLTEDYLVEEKIELNENAAYVYSARYPRVDPSDPSAELINTFYEYLVDDTLGFGIPISAEYYRDENPPEDITVKIDYTVTCNNDDFFGVLIRTEQEGICVYAGHTFSRKGLKPGFSVTMPYLLGLLESDENDTWLQDRQTAKANALIREMVWEQLQNREDLELPEDLDGESLEFYFFPEEDFYLDETGNPVFYLEPGIAAEGDELICFPIPLEEILDEM